MESLVLAFVTPGDLFISSHHPDQGSTAKEASRESINGWKMKCNTGATRFTALWGKHMEHHPSSKQDTSQVLTWCEPAAP